MLQEFEKPIVEFMDKRKKQTANIPLSEAGKRRDAIVNEALDRFQKDIPELSRDRAVELYMKDF